MRSLRVIARRLGVPVYALQARAGTEDAGPDREAAELLRLLEQERYAEVVRAARDLLVRELPPDQQASVTLSLGRALARLAQPAEAAVALRRARRLYESLEDPWQAAEALAWEASAAHLRGDPHAVPLAEEALRRYRQHEPRRPDVEARMLEHLAAFLVGQGSHDRARVVYEEALRVAGGERDLTGLGRIYRGLSRCAAGSGDGRRAIDLATRAVALHAVEHEMRPVPDSVDLPAAESDLGAVLLGQGQLDRAEELFHSALQHFEEAGVERDLSLVLLGVARLRRRQGRLDESLHLAGQAVALAGRLGESGAAAAGHQLVGQLHAERGADDLADESFERALDVLTRAGLTGRKEQCLAAYREVLAARAARLNVSGLRG